MTSRLFVYVVHHIHPYHAGSTGLNSQDTNQNELITFFLLRQVPALCLFICATTLIVCQCLVVTMTADHGDPLAALCILVLVIAFGAAARRVVLIQSLHTLHDALHPYSTR